MVAEKTFIVSELGRGEGSEGEEGERRRVQVLERCGEERCVGGDKGDEVRETALVSERTVAIMMNGAQASGSRARLIVARRRTSASSPCGIESAVLARKERIRLTKIRPVQRQ